MKNFLTAEFCSWTMKANLDILVEGLKPNHKLSLALNGEMALQIAARTPPDLVLLDINDARADRCH